MYPAGISERGMKNTVFVPVGILVPTHWESRPRSFARLVFQMSLSGPCVRWEYSRDWPVSVSITVLEWFVQGLLVVIRCQVARA